MRRFNPSHVGRILKIWPDAMAVSGAALRLNVVRPTTRLEESVGSTREFWIGLQMEYDLAQAEMKKRPKVIPIGAAAGKSGHTDRADWKARTRSAG